MKAAEVGDRPRSKARKDGNAAAHASGNGASGDGTGPKSVAERVAAGKALRQKLPRGAHAEWTPAADRPDPVALLERQGQDRVPELVPIRYGRMLASPFAFLRGSAIVMADDLSHTPSAGIPVQACGDCHLANFGIFATPERNIVFDITDFDETLPGPWEWDVKRLAASFEVAGRHRDFGRAQRRLAVLAMLQSYRDRMSEFAAMRTLDVWYARIDARLLLEAVKEHSKDMHRNAQKGVQKATGRDHLDAQSKLTEIVRGKRRFIPSPPTLERVSIAADQDFIRRTLSDYSSTLLEDRRHVLGRFTVVDVAHKVVGVGSVGTRCFVVLLQGRDDHDPFFLQVKEATASVLEPYLEKCRHENHGQRVVEGQRLTQASSDIFLGWIRGRGEERRDFYLRQLRDVKGSADLEIIQPSGLLVYGQVCGHALARAHARSGDAALISGYVGSGDAFPDAIADFAYVYADQTERDHAALAAAVRSGKIEAKTGI
jgi:uncharacterized protein (DUF2252 family)